MKLHHLTLIPLVSAMLLGGCVSSQAMKLNNITQSHSGAVTDLNNYNGKIHVFFTIKDQSIELDEIKTKIERSDIEALYLPNAQNTKQKIRKECVTIQSTNQRYQPCYTTLNLHGLGEKSIFIKGNVSASGLLTSVIAAPFAAVGVAVNAVTLNPRGVADSVKGVGKTAMDYSVDSQALQQVGRYIDDKLAQAQKNARQALATYNVDLVQQAKGLQGLLRDDEYHNAYVVAKNNEQRVAVFHILGMINGHSQKFDNFTRIVLKSPKDLPLWANTISATAYQPRLSLQEAKKIPSFASSENMKDFFNSNEYRYILQYLKPEKVTLSTSGQQAGINVNYGQGVSVFLSRPATCQEKNTRTATRQQNAAWFTFGFGSDYVVTEKITEYSCQASSEVITQLQNWERQLTGNVSVTSNFPRSWTDTRTNELSRDKIHYDYSASAPSGNTSYEVTRTVETGGWGYSGYEYKIYCNSTGWTQVSQLDKRKSEYYGGGKTYNTLDQAARAACRMN